MSEIAATICVLPFESTADLLTSKMVTVLAGPDRVPYHVHHDVLCNRSAHCRAALQGPFTEAQSGQIAFPEEQPYTIKLFLHWVYQLNLPPCRNPVDLQHNISLMSFARSILLEELQNACMDSIRTAFRNKSQDREAPTICGKDLSLAYETTPELRKLRFFMCFQAALQLTTKVQSENSDWMDEHLAQLLEQGGDLVLDLPKLLVYCSGLRLSTSNGWPPETERNPHSEAAAGQNVPTSWTRYRSRRCGNGINPPDNLNELISPGPSYEDWGYGAPRSTQPQAKSDLGLQASTLSSAYNCLFHEHHGAATCSSVKAEESVSRSISKAWQCFDKKQVSVDKKGDTGGDRGKSQEAQTT